MNFTTPSSRSARATRTWVQGPQRDLTSRISMETLHCALVVNDRDNNAARNRRDTAVNDH